MVVLVVLGIYLYGWLLQYLFIAHLFINIWRKVLVAPTFMCLLWGHSLLSSLLVLNVLCGLPHLSRMPSVTRLANYPSPFLPPCSFLHIENNPAPYLTVPCPSRFLPGLSLLLEFPYDLRVWYTMESLPLSIMCLLYTYITYSLILFFFSVYCSIDDKDKVSLHL